MSRSDVIVIGAGPAGVSAAVVASENGLDVTLIDEAPAPGGQVYKAPPHEFRLGASRRSRDTRDGEKLRALVGRSRVRLVTEQTVWLVTRGFHVHTFGTGALRRYQGDALVVATGTYERIVPFPGWTLPGVIGVGAATLLVKGQQVLPGRRTVVAGCGPLLPVAAAAIVKAGGAIAAYVDLNGPGELLRALPALATWPGRLAYGLGLLRDIRRSGAPMLGRHAVVEVRGRHGVEEVRVASVGPDGRPHPRSTMRMFAADALAIGHGLIPATEITQLLGATHAYRRESGGWVPITQDRVRTSVPGLYVAGDGAGVTGASAAVLHGRLAGLAVVRDAGRLSGQAHDRRAAEIRRSLAWDERFARGVRGMMQAPEGLLDLMTPQTIVCRCEDLTRNDIDHAVARGARGMNELKAWTRCGMGPCQGRTCGETAAELVAARVGGRENTGRWTPRPPIRPIPIDILAGEFAYGDIVLPPQAPA